MIVIQREPDGTNRMQLSEGLDEGETKGTLADFQAWRADLLAWIPHHLNQQPSAGRITSPANAAKS